MATYEFIMFMEQLQTELQGQKFIYNPRQLSKDLQHTYACSTFQFHLEIITMIERSIVLNFWKRFLYSYIPTV